MVGVEVENSVCCFTASNSRCVWNKSFVIKGGNPGPKVPKIQALPGWVEGVLTPACSGHSSFGQVLNVIFLLWSLVNLLVKCSGVWLPINLPQFLIAGKKLLRGFGIADLKS